LNCALAFECPQVWDALQATHDPDVRFCTQCRKSVTFCRTQEQLDELQGSGDCVAFQSSEVRQLLGSVRAVKSKPVVRESLRRFIDSI